MNEVINPLKYLREKCNYTEEEAAGLLGLHVSRYMEYEMFIHNFRDYKVNTIYRFSKVFKTPVAEVLRLFEEYEAYHKNLIEVSDQPTEETKYVCLRACYM